ncbi:MAG: hypothetical protein JJ992_02365, partial [Planctomycetes bacterium]|nr:hypothetical protein [Planctomycetota bacterium]
MNVFSQLMYWITTPFRWLFYLPMSVISAPRRLMGISLPARVAWVTAIMLLLCAVAAFVSVLMTKGSAEPWENYWHRWQTPAIVLLLIVIPPVVYFAVKSWMEGEVSPYPDIERAWNAGMAALAEHGLDPADLPLFLVLGESDERLAKALFSASGLNLTVQNVPAGHVPLSWYAGEDGIFVVSRDASYLSRATSLSSGRPADGAVRDLDGRGTAQSPDPLRGTMDPGGARGTGGFRPADSVGPDALAGQPNVRGTLVPGGLA